MHPEAVRARRHRAEHPKKAAARKAVERAIANGTLVRGSCEVGVDCKGKIDAHHDDYDQPLKVRWFCRRHHRTGPDAGKSARPETAACPKCGTEWSIAESGTKYCRPCGARRMQQTRERRAEVRS